MSRGLRALEELKFQVGNITYCTKDLQVTPFQVRDVGLFETIEKELKEYEFIKQIMRDYDLTLTDLREACILFHIVKLKGEKKKLIKKIEALNIIKDKDVNPIDIRCCDTVEQYNVKENGNIRLIQEEFDLLKEVLL